MAFLTWTRGIRWQQPSLTSTSLAPTPIPNIANLNLPHLQVDDLKPLASHPIQPQAFTMAPVPLEAHISYASVALLVGHLVTAAGLTIAVAKGLYQSHRALGPSQDTRERRDYRRRLVPVFVILALLSLATASSASLQHAILSYKTWASQRDIQVPAQLFGQDGFINNTSTYRNLGLWATQTPFRLDGLQILTERARRFWWSQQADLSLIPFNVFLFLEGRRRNITKLPCYSLLSQLVSLPFAQNLFFLAILLTPAPLPDRSLQRSGFWSKLRHPKSDSWVPHPILISLWVSATYFVFYQISDASSVNSKAFQTLALASRALVTLPLLAPYVLPSFLGLEAHHRGTYHWSVAVLFKVIAAGNLTLFLLTTSQGLKFNSPDAYYHRHSIHLPFDVEKRSAWERTTTATGRILTAVADHPVVQGATFDVILSTVSLGVWAAVRATSVQNMVACVLPGVLTEGDDGTWFSHLWTNPEKDDTRSKAQSKTIKRRSRVKKEEDSSEESYEPSEAGSIPEGDVIPESDLDWESTAVALGLTVIGGLGLGSAGVLGAECVHAG